MLIQQLIPRLRSWLITPGQRGLSGTEQGSVLVATIIAVTIAASLGTAIYSFVSTSQFTQIGSMNDTKAYYLAESGGHYGVKQLMLHPPADATACNTLLAKTYTVTDAGQFTILPDCTRTAASGYAEYRFTSKGTPTDATISRQISYIIQLPDTGGVNIPFDGSGSTLKAENWNTSGTTARVDDSTVTLNSSGSATQASLDWNNPSSTLPKLSTIWSGDGKMLSYEVQAKVNLNSSSSKDVAAGISFRLKTQNNSSFTDDSFYALSYLWCGNSSADQLDSLCGSNTSHTYIVLWKQTASGVKTVIGRQRASSVSGSLVDSNDKLEDWATLVVRIQEQIDPTTEVRENIIYAFVGDPTTNPKGTIAWDYTNFATVKWAADSFFTGLDCSGGLKAYVADSDYLTTNFDTQPQDEVGVHALGGTSGQVADLALRFSFNGGQSSVCTSTGPGAIYLKSATSSVSEGGGTVTITAGRKNGASGAVGVNYATVSGGTATAGSDYTAASGTLSWSALDIADQTFTIPISDDTDYENDETVNLALTTPTGGATLGTPSTAVLTITDNDGVRVLNSWPTTAIDSGTSNSLSATFATSAGSNRFLVCAVTSELSDYTTSFAVSGTYGGKGFTTLKSTTGLSNRQHVWLGYIKESDLASRTGDTVSVTITAGKSVDAADLNCGSYQGVDQANPIAGSRANSNSGSSTVSFGGNLTVVNGGYAIYAVAANGASSTPPAGYLEHWDKSINGYSTSGGSKRVTASGSDNKSWSLSSNNRWGLAVASLKPGASGAIAGIISFSTTAYSVNEGDGTATITASRLDGASGAVSVSYATANGTASAGADYTTASGTLSWADGDTADQTFTVPITDDTAFEGSETINLTLSGPTNGAVLGDASADLTIVDNETGITVDDPWVAVKSGTSGSMSGSFTTSAGANRLLVCAVTTELSGSTTSFSVSGTYGSKSFTLLKSTSSLSSRQHVWLGYVKESDIASHGSDTVSMTISAGNSVDAADLYCGSYAGVDQSNPVVDKRANSNSGSSSPSFGGNVNVVSGGYILYAVAANGASSTQPSGYAEHWDKAANSYSTSGGSKQITADGTENKSCTLNSSERWGLAVGSLRPGAGGGAGAGTIDFSATTYSVNENGGTATITAKRSGGSTGAVGVSYATSNGTASAGSDYGSASATLTWADGDTADQTFTVAITDDSSLEGNETVNLTLSAPTGGATLGTASAVLTIADNDAGVTVLNAWPSTPQLTVTTGNNMSGSFAISAGANRLLVVAISCYDNGGANGQTFTVTYGGKTLNQAKLENSNRRQTWIGYLTESAIASKSGDTVSVTISGSHDDATALVASYQNVNQGTPVAASGSTYINNTNNVAVNSSALNVGAGEYGLYVWSGTQGVSRSSDTESYTEHADKDINSDFRVGIASKAFTATGTTNPNPNWSANIRASVSIIVLQ